MVEEVLIDRALEDRLVRRLADREVLILYGPRQVGKTTLAMRLIGKSGKKTLILNADEARHVETLSSRDARKFRRLAEGYEMLFIDEAQRVPEIGLNLKIIHDQIPTLKILATGSSSLDLADRTKEALTGRSWSFTLYPISVSELLSTQTPFELQESLEELLVYGMYPEAVTSASLEGKRDYLKELIGSYLYKDLLEIGGVAHPHKIGQLLRLLAYQIGSTVSLSELGGALQLSKDTVQRYIDLLEKSFVVFRLSGFSGNLRKEITKMDKIYFFDLGVRNAIIENFNALDFRDDCGQLWENFLMIERRKARHYANRQANQYFWRTYTGAELDLVEEEGGKLRGFEFKYRPKKAKAPKTWMETYPNATFDCIHSDNFLEFVSTV